MRPPSAGLRPCCPAAGPVPSAPERWKKHPNRLRPCPVDGPRPSGPGKKLLLHRQLPRQLRPPRQQLLLLRPALRPNRPSLLLQHPQSPQRLPARSPNSLPLRPRCPADGPHPSDRLPGNCTHKSALPALSAGRASPVIRGIPDPVPERGWRASQGRCLWLT